MDHLWPLWPKKNTHHVEPISVTRAMEPAHPIPRRLHQLPLFPPMNRSKRPAVVKRHACLDLDERNRTLQSVLRPLRNEIDISVATPEPPLQDVAPSSDEKPLRGSLTTFSE